MEMIRKIAMASACVLAMSLMVLALWAWGQAGALTAYASRPEIACWAVRSAAVSAGAMAQLLVLTLVIGQFQRGRKHRLQRDARYRRPRRLGRAGERDRVGLGGTVSFSE